MPHYLGIAIDVDHSNTTSVSFFHKDTTVLFGGPCRLCVLLNRSCNSGSQLQNGNHVHSDTLSAHTIFSFPFQPTLPRSLGWAALLS